MKKLISFCFLLFSALAVFGQYWIGPKFGYHYVIHDYQDESYENQYDIGNTFGWEAGLAVTYEASERYSVHGELYYDKIGKDITNSQSTNYAIESTANYHFISAPILLRVTLGHSPVHYYINGGPKLSYWLGGNGTIFADGGQEEPRFDYNLAFRTSDVDLNDRTYLVEAPNRLQYALTAGAGFYLDLRTGARLMVDFRYMWGHSNMGFTSEAPDFDSRTLVFGNPADIPESGYQENYEYTQNMLTVAVAYQFEYNAQLKRKGGSTSKEAKKTKQAARKKK